MPAAETPSTAVADLPVAEPSPVAPAGPGQLVMSAPRRGKPPRHFADLEPSERGPAMVELGEKAFRGKQLATQWFERLQDDPEKMTDLPAASRDRIASALLPTLLTPVRTLTADKGTTVKSLYRLHDGALIETVLMRYKNRDTLCISSQAGCGMNCPFCATGQAGLTRNLSTAEIVEQVTAASRALARGEVAGGPGRVGNIVFMGMGEALANYRSAVAAVRRIVAPAPDGLGISARGVTMSTVGLVPAIDKFAQEGIAATLALSLHAPDDELRDELVPVNRRWNVGQALDAARRYFEATGRRVSIEYALIKDVNDQAWRGDRLGKLLNARGRGWVHVNPIPLNPTPGSKWTASDPAVEKAFVAALEARGIPTTIRDTRGSEIDGACGQLAAIGPEQPSTGQVSLGLPTPGKPA